MKLLFQYFLFLIGLSLLAVPQTYAATTAEASVGESATVQKYDLSTMSEDEKEWFTAFLEGNFLIDGWKEISSDILSNIKPHEREEQKVRLHELGFKIGSEQSKGNEVRKIDNDKLRKWGKVLKNTAEDAPHLLTEVIQRIDTEVNNLLN